MRVEDASYNLRRECIDGTQRKKRELFYEDYKTDGFYSAVRKNIKLSFKQRVKLELSNILNRTNQWDKKN